MNYRQLIKQRFPAVANALRNNPSLMKIALKAEQALPNKSGQPVISPKHANTINQDAMAQLAIAKQHGLFEFQWYCDVQNKPFANEQQAFSDYLHKSRFSSVSPSPNFDNLSYQKNNLDVYHANLSPLAHFLSTGIEENRVAVPFSPKWTPSDSLDMAAELEAFEPETLNNAKVAVCLHVFYADFIDYYAECLRYFPTSVDLLISVSDIAYQPDIEQKLASLDKVKNVKVREVPNRGRNFGPMLVEFAQDLQDYDLFCHLHSKKSLYSGRPQTQWADYLGEFLLRDDYIIKQMMSYMLSQDDVGLYYPTSFSMMPDWVNHWLKNKPFKAPFFDDWGLTDHSEFLPYPVGGMFWAKPAAVKQLLEKTYQYEDFPEEPLPNDGSPLHALERCIGLLAERNGYRQLFYYPELGRFTHDKTYVFANYVCDKTQLLHKVQPFDIISFDVFDTLVRRSHHVPDYAKLKLGLQLLAEGHLPDGVDAHQFVNMRNQAEFEVRKAKQFKGDVNLFESYQQLAASLSWDETQAHHFAELEFEYDLDMIESKEEVVAILNQLIGMGKQVYVVSDTYYTEYQIVLMLRKAGVTNGYQLFVSSELGLRKDNGTMWKMMSETLDNPSRFVHIGDNAVADAQIPGDFGLANLHILNPIDKWQAAGRQDPFTGEHALNEQQILKWGPLVSQFGRFPFLGE